MKIYKKALRYWIAIASLFSFLGGWIILAHSPKPVQAQTNQLSALPTIQAYDSNTNNSGRSLFSTNSQAVPRQSSGMPLLRTRGS
jgi:hypothetical protein